MTKYGRHFGQRASFMPSSQVVQTLSILGYHLQQLLLFPPQPMIDQMTRHRFDCHSRVVAFLALGLRDVLNLKCIRLSILMLVDVDSGTSPAIPTSWRHWTGVSWLAHRYSLSLVFAVCCQSARSNAAVKRNRRVGWHTRNRCRVNICGVNCLVINLRFHWIWTLVC